MFWLVKGDVPVSPLAQLVQTYSADGEDHTLYVLWQKDCVASAKHSCCPKDSQKCANPAGWGQPVLSSLPKNWEFWELLIGISCCWPENLCPPLSHISPHKKVASWMPVPLFKWHLPKEEFSKTEWHSFVANISHQVLNLKQESGNISMLFIFFTGSAKAQTHTAHTHAHTSIHIILK